MENKTITYSTNTASFINIIGSVVLVIGIIMSIIFLVKGIEMKMSYSNDEGIVFFLYSIVALISSLFISALCFTLASINKNLNILSNVKKYELNEIGIVIKPNE